MTSGHDSDDELGLGDLPQFARVGGPTPVRPELCTVQRCGEHLADVTEQVSNSGLATRAVKTVP